MTEVKRLLTRPEAATYCGLKPSAFSDWVRKGTMPNPVPGTRRWDKRAIDAKLDAMAGLKSVDRRIVERELSQDIQEFVALKGSAPEGTLFEWTKNNAPSQIANFGLHTLLKLLDNERAIDRIIHLQWYVRDVGSSSRKLLLGDDPFCRVNDLYKPRTLIAMPLSPTHVFFGTDADDILQNVMTTMTPREIVNRMNIETLQKAKQFVYGDAERSFVDKHFPRHSLIAVK